MGLFDAAIKMAEGTINCTQVLIGTIERQHTMEN